MATKRTAPLITIELNDSDAEYLALQENGRRIMDKLEVWIVEYWGGRCEDFEADCYCCRAWKAFDGMAKRIPERGE